MLLECEHFANRLPRPAAVRIDFPATVTVGFNCGRSTDYAIHSLRGAIDFSKNTQERRMIGLEATDAELQGGNKNTSDTAAAKNLTPVSSQRLPPRTLSQAFSASLTYCRTSSI